MQADQHTSTCAVRPVVHIAVAVLIALAVGACGGGGTTEAVEVGVLAPPADHSQKRLHADGAAIDVHLHLASQTLADIFSGGELPAAEAEDAIARLDEAHVDRGVVLAAGYMGFPVGFEDDSNVAPENDYVAAEVAKYPDRLIGFCGINPLFASAVHEVDRCLDLPGMVGVKIHMEGSGVDMTDDADVAALSAVFDAVEARNAPVLMHAADPSGFPLTAVGYRNLFSVLGDHPTLRVTHAHCAGRSDMDAIEQIRRVAGSEYTANAWVDMSACLHYFEGAPKAERERIVWELRQWGIENVLFGSDYLQFLPEQTPLETLQTLSRYPFTQREIDTILANDGSDWLEGPG